MTRAAVALLLVASLALTTRARGQQPVVIDTAFHPVVAHPAYPMGTGPRVLIDEAHHDLHSVVGLHETFGELIRLDGYRVGSLAVPLSAKALHEADVVVIADPLPAPTDEESDTLGSAFTTAELDALESWIRKGGALLLFVDHRPFPNAAHELGVRLGLQMLNGYALDYEVWDPIVFSRARGTLRPSPITNGRDSTEWVDSVTTFYGHAMRPIGPGIVPIMVFGPEIESMQPKGLWEIDDDTPRIPVGGWLQGAALRLGRGRVVVYGEAGMAVAQRIGPKAQPRGMNAPVAGQNAQLLLNTMHWLTGVVGR